MLQGYTPGQLAIYRSSPEKAPEEVQLYFTGAKMPMQKAERIKHEVALSHGITIKELTGREKSRRYSRPRQEAMYRIAKETNYPLAQIGRCLKRDHTTVIHGINSHCDYHNLPNPRGAIWKRKHEK